MELRWTVFSLNLGALPQTPDTMSFPSRDAVLQHACGLPPGVKILYIENSEGQRIQGEEVEKLCRIQSCYGNIALSPWERSPPRMKRKQSARRESNSRLSPTAKTASSLRGLVRVMIDACTEKSSRRS